MPLSKSQYARFKELLAKGLRESLSALEKLAPNETSLTSLDDDPKRSTKMQKGLLWAAAGAPVRSDMKQDAWTWLESKGLSWPKAQGWDLAVTVLEQYDLGLLDWLEERWGPLDSSWGMVPSGAWAAAMRRTNTAGLERLFREMPVPPPAESQMGWFELAITWHRNSALPYVNWLLQHGVTPHPSEATQALILATRSFYDNAGAQSWQSPPSLEKAQGLQRDHLELWDTLLAAGADPHVPHPFDGVSAWDRAMLTSIQGPLLARQRAEEAPTAAPVRRSPRPRA